MNKYNSGNIGSTFTKELLLEAIEKMKPHLSDFPPLNRFIAEGNKMTDTLTMITGDEGFKDIHEIKTIHGVLKIQYSRYTEPDKVYFMSPIDYLKPNFSNLF